MSVSQVLTTRASERNQVAPSFKHWADLVFANQLEQWVKQCKFESNSKDLSKIKAHHLVAACQKTPLLNTFFRGEVVGIARSE